jgi:hypothetical protein
MPLPFDCLRDGPFDKLRARRRVPRMKREPGDRAHLERKPLRGKSGSGNQCSTLIPCPVAGVSCFQGG